MIGGIDEAGRGPVFGPMVVAGVSGADQETFRALGVKDSKLLAPERRTRLARDIEGVARRIESVHIDAMDIDQRRADETLNEIEVSAFAVIARKLGVPELFVDAADVVAPRFGRDILRHLGPEAGVVRIVAEHRADSTYPVVSAASIIAKVQRDREVARLGRPLEKEIGLPVGSGYSTDPVTMTFLEAYFQRRRTLPAGTRLSWETARALESRLKTRKLEEFLVAAPPKRRVRPS
ncbi:MAG TPA: ribonuclease HII [Candidatus Thermoplasmatota archaeon]|nr:ribonuclease HII [Candidatus Thermoplasmatota archaeon]